MRWKSASSSDSVGIAPVVVDVDGTDGWNERERKMVVGEKARADVSLRLTWI